MEMVLKGIIMSKPEILIVNLLIVITILPHKGQGRCERNYNYNYDNHCRNNNNYHNVNYKNCGFESTQCCSQCENFSTATRLEIINQTIFDDFPNLHSIDLGHNSINEIDERDPLKLQDLTELKLSNNFITKLGPDCFETRELRVLELDHNQIQEIDTIALSRLHNLETIQLSHNEITDLKLSLIHMTNLKIMDVSHNSLSKLDINEFTVALQLDDVDLSDNNLDNYSFITFARSTKLRKLNMMNNNISHELTKEELGHISNIKELYLSNNNIPSIEADAFNGLHIENLDISYNKVVGELRADTFEGINSFKFINMSNNLISSIDGEVIIKFVNLTDINVSHNMLNGTIKIVGTEDTILETLDLSYNHIEKIELESMKYLQTVNLTNNCISTNILKDIQKVSYLDLSYNNITTFTIDELFDLEYFYIKHNLIAQIKLNTFENNNRLVVLSMNNNRLERIDAGVFKTLESLQILDLSYNLITQITNGAFTGLKSLQTLNLKSNRLKIFEALHLYSVKYIKSILLDANELMDLDIDTMLKFSVDVTISIGENFFTCKRLVDILVAVNADKRIKLKSDNENHNAENVAGIQCISANPDEVETKIYNSNDTLHFHVLAEHIIASLKNITNTFQNSALQNNKNITDNIITHNDKILDSFQNITNYIVENHNDAINKMNNTLIALKKIEINMSNKDSTANEHVNAVKNATLKTQNSTSINDLYQTKTNTINNKFWDENIKNITDNIMTNHEKILNNLMNITNKIVDGHNDAIKKMEDGIISQRRFNVTSKINNSDFNDETNINDKFVKTTEEDTKSKSDNVSAQLNKLHEKIEEIKNNHIYTNYAIASTVVFLLLCGLGYFYYRKTRTTTGHFETIKMSSLT